MGEKWHTNNIGDFGYLAPNQRSDVNAMKFIVMSYKSILLKLEDA
jgi:hypothetical protein